MSVRIRELRKAKKWTVEQLAEVVGTSKGYISELENEKRTGSVPMLRAIFEALGAPDLALNEQPKETQTGLSEDVPTYAVDADEPPQRSQKREVAIEDNCVTVSGTYTKDQLETLIKRLINIKENMLE